MLLTGTSRSATVAAALVFLAASLIALPAPGESKRQVTMKPVGPNCGMEVLYRRSSSELSEAYSVHAEEFLYNGLPAYQVVSIYRDRVRRVTMRKSDLTPLAYVEKGNDNAQLIERLYQDGQVRMVRRGLPDPLDEVYEVPPGVHDPETSTISVNNTFSSIK